MIRRVRASLSLMILSVAFGLGACTSVDSTDHCILTRKGKIVEEQMSPGNNFTPMTDATCFSLTDQNFPEVAEGQDTKEAKETVNITTEDRRTVQVDLAMVWRYNRSRIVATFSQKRDPNRIRFDIFNSMREGPRNAGASWTTAEFASPMRESFADSAKAYVNRKLGGVAEVVTVYVRDIRLPADIEAAQKTVMEANARRTAETQQLAADSAANLRRILRAQTTAEERRLEAQSYENNPRLLDLRIAEQQANALSKACSGAAVTHCVIGGSVVDAYQRP